MAEEVSPREYFHRSRKGQCKLFSFSEPLASKILAKDIYTLEHEAKAKLLSRAVPFSRNYKDTAEEILGYVQGLSEGALKSVFTLKSDDISQIPLRLLNPGKRDQGPSVGDDEVFVKIERQSEGVENLTLRDESPSSETEESYVTASYCWIKPTDKDEMNAASIESTSPASSSIVDGLKSASYPLPFSPLLYHALLNERKTPREGVWVDQVCINQSSSSEKQIAVNAMDLIYKCARTVVILLDDIEVSLAEQDFLASYALEFEEYDGEGGYSQPHFRERPPFMKANPILRDFFLKFVGAKWFERAWCMHEMRLSTRHVFLIKCEAESQPNNGLKPLPTVLRFTTIFMVHLIGLAIPADLKHPRLSPLLSVFSDSLITNLGFKSDIPSYMRVFADVFRQCAGGNPAIADPVAREHDANLDKLSIAINTIGLGLGVMRAVPVDKDDDVEKKSLPLATADECCRRFTTLAIAAADPSALCSKGPELQLGNKSKMRTWMHWPLFDDIGSSTTDMPRLRRFDVDFDPSAEAAYIGLDMCFFNGEGEGPRAGGVKWASERKLRICRSFKEACELRKIASVNYNFVYGKSLDRLQIRKAVIRTLAAIMECGLDWLSWIAEHVLENWDSKLLEKAVRRLLEHEEFASKQGNEERVFDTKYLDSQAGRREAEVLLDLARYLMHNGLPWNYEKSLGAYEAICLVRNGPVGRADNLSEKVEGGASSSACKPSHALMYACIPDAGSNVDVICATPTVLLHDDYSSLFRGWSLIKGIPEKVTDDAGIEKWKYHVLGKSAIFGMVSGVESSVNAGEGGVLRGFGRTVKGVRMYGLDG